MGRPSEYTQEMADRICDALSKNGSIRKTAEEVGVDRATIGRWVEAHEDFATAIARAKSAGYDERAEKAVADAIAATDPGLGRLAFDAERWYLSKIDPNRYGDSLKLKHADADGEKIKLDEVGTVTRLAAIAAQIKRRQDAPDESE